MGDEDFAPATGGFMFKISDDGEWHNLGYVSEGGISLVSDSDEDELEAWTDKLLSLNNETVTFSLKTEWWSLNRLYKLVTGRYRYTVPKLRKGKKGH